MDAMDRTILESAISKIYELAPRGEDGDIEADMYMACEAIDRLIDLYRTTGKPC